MKDLTGKKLLVLGSAGSTVNVVKQAKKMGLYVVTTGNPKEGQAADLADEAIGFSTDDYPALVEFIKTNHIDGVMTGSSEFNVLNMIKLCKMANLPCYATEEQWDATQDKRHFKDLCKRFGVPGVPEFGVDDVLTEKDFPVIVKPVDSYSSIGISICHNNKELAVAKEKALAASASKTILIERYIDNGGLTHNIKYVVVNGEFYMEVMCDRYVVKGGLITAVSFFPSINTKSYLATIDKNVKDMFLSIGFTNGVFFLSAIPEKDNIYIYEMGLRTGGGMNYKITEATSGNNDLEMLIHYAITGEMCETKDIQTIDPYLKGKQAASLAMPSRVGTIGQIEGGDRIENIDGVVNYTHFREVGDVITEKQINTLNQLYGRVMIVRNDKKQLFEGLEEIRNTISVKDINGRDMIMWETYDDIYAHNYLK